jgi:hypothetical protein
LEKLYFCFKPKVKVLPNPLKDAQLISKKSDQNHTAIPTPRHMAMPTLAKVPNPLKIRESSSRTTSLHQDQMASHHCWREDRHYW